MLNSKNVYCICCIHLHLDLHLFSLPSYVTIHLHLHLHLHLFSPPFFHCSLKIVTDNSFPEEKEKHYLTSSCKF